MIQFEWPWLFLILPIPWLIRLVLPPVQPVQDSAIIVPFLDDLERLTAAESDTGASHFTLWLAVLAWCLLVVASARPQWLGDPISQAISGRDLWLAVDLSGSMKESDFILQGQQVDRLTATKWVASRFIDKRAGDRLGLILFGDNAYLHVPLTFDLTTVQVLLMETFIGMAGEKTAIGDAIGLAVKHIKKNEAEHKVLILLTDGANTAGSVSPLKAAELAAAEGLKIYTIGVGADAMLVRSLFGTRRVNPSSDLDEDTLRGIAGKTDGRYFRARDIDELSEIYGLLDELEPVAKDQQYFRPRTALYIWPLLIAMIIAAFLSILHISGRLRS